MMRRPWNVSYLLTGLICLAMVWSCAGREYLIVDYKIPDTTKQLQGQSVRIRVEDQREDLKIMSAEAAKEFIDFGDRYSLAWITPEKRRILAGEHDLSALFKRTFEKRLMLMGGLTSSTSQNQDPELTISIQKFTIGLQDQKWVADVGYTATLTQEGHPITKEQVRGNAERLRLVGRKGADAVVSDIFTEVVNRLDMAALFRKAELIP